MTTVVATAAAYAGLYPTVASRRQLTASIGANGSPRAIYGPAYDLTTAGGFAAWRILVQPTRSARSRARRWRR